MNWIALESEDQIQNIKELSSIKFQVIFKHSTRCSISSMALNRLRNSTQINTADFYLLDLIKYRNISSIIAEDFKVFHKSPQVLIIKNAECIYNESHSGITIQNLLESLN